MEPLDIAQLRHGRRLGVDLQAVAGRRRVEEGQGLLVGEARELGRFEEGAGPVGLLDQRLDRRRRPGGQAEAQVDRGLQPLLEGLVVDAERRLEGRDHVADHIFGGVVQQGGQAPARLHVRPDMGEDLLDDDRVLGDREGVLADGLAVPARDPGQAVGDVLDLYIHGRGVEQVQPAARQHPLPGAGLRLRTTQPFPHESIPSTVKVVNWLMA